MRMLERSRISGAPLRKSYALHRVRDTSSYGLIATRVSSTTSFGVA